MSDQKSLFIISPIGSRGSETRIHFDKVRNHIIDPVATEKGYSTLRSDEIARPGRITSQIIDHLKNDDLVVADLSRKNPNVYYELAIRHAVKKAVILLGESDLDIPFDLAAQRVIPYSLDPDDILEAKRQLASQIDTVDSDQFIVDSPVSDAIDIPPQSTTSEDKIQRILAILETQSTELKELRSIKPNIPTFPGFVAEAQYGVLMDTLPDRYHPIARIFLRSKGETFTIKDIAKLIEKSPNTASIYLRNLRDMGLLETTMVDNRRIYRLSPSYR